MTTRDDGTTGDRDFDRTLPEDSSGFVTPTSANAISTFHPKGAPDGAELWEVGPTGESVYYLAYFVPDTDPPVPMVWRVPSTEDLESFFGPGQPVEVTRRLQFDELDQAGAIRFGTTDELPDSEIHPADVMTDQFEKELEVKPWLRDPEVFALTMGAFLEGRSVTTAELQTTDWWKETPEAVRQWAALEASDPATAERIRQDNRLAVENYARSLGIANLPDRAIDYIETQWSTGQWSQAQMRAQVEGIAYGADIDGKLAGIISDTELDISVPNVEEVRSLVRRWLGPAAVEGYDEEFYTTWAKRIADAGGANDQLVEFLRGQRKTTLPGYEESLTYEDIVGPYRSEWFRILGTRPDETDPTFIQGVRENDMESFARRARRWGLEHDNEKIRNDILGGLVDQLRGGIA